MDMEVMTTMDITVREKQRLLLLLSQVMDTMDMVMVLVMDMDMVMDTMDIMARDLLMLSQDMDTMVMVMDMDMVMDTMDTMARDLLSQDMDTMVMDMDMVMVMDMVMDMDIMDKYQSFFDFSLEFSLNEIVALTTNWYKSLSKISE